MAVRVGERIEQDALAINNDPSRCGARAGYAKGEAHELTMKGGGENARRAQDCFYFVVRQPPPPAAVEPPTSKSMEKVPTGCVLMIWGS